jgi:hypothetical protein
MEKREKGKILTWHIATRREGTLSGCLQNREMNVKAASIAGAALPHPLFLSF